MKTVKSILISLAMSVLFMNIALANPANPVIKVIEKKLYLSLENGSAQTSVRILDREGVSLIEEQVTASVPFESVFNLESLPTGSYTLVIKSTGQETVQPITVTSTELIIEEIAPAAKRSGHFFQEKEKYSNILLKPHQ